MFDVGASRYLQGDSFVQIPGKSQDLSQVISQIMGRAVCEADEGGSSVSWGTSQIVNDALAAFQADAAVVANDGEFLSVTGSPMSSVQQFTGSSDELSLSERDELEVLRAMVGNIRLHGSSSGDSVVVERGSFWDVPNAVQSVQSVRNRPILAGQPVAVAEAVGATAQSSGPTLVPREVKLSKPSTFSGRKTEVDNFIFEMRQYVDSIGLGDAGTACRFVVSHLKGDALTWWRSYSQDSMQIFAQLDLDTLLHDLRQQFIEIDEDMKLRDRLINLRQTRSVAQFVSEFRGLQLRLGANRVEDTMAYHLFLFGLKPAVRDKVMMEQPATLSELILLAERADQAQWWSRDFAARRQVYGGARGSGAREDLRKVSQYSNSRYKGPAPMVLGTAETGNARGVAGKSVVCHHCGRRGHFKRDCWKLNGKPQNPQAKATTQPKN